MSDSIRPISSVWLKTVFNIYIMKATRNWKEIIIFSKRRITKCYPKPSLGKRNCKEKCIMFMIFSLTTKRFEYFASFSGEIE